MNKNQGSFAAPFPMEFKKNELAQIQKKTQKKNKKQRLRILVASSAVNVIIIVVVLQRWLC